MSETETENLDNEVTDTSTTNQEAKFTQEDVNKLIAQRVDREKSKFNKKYDGIDVDRYNNLVNAEEERDIDAKKDGVIDSLTTELRDIKVNGNLLSEASAKHAINPNQVVQLLQGQVKLNDGSVEVLDSSTQQVRYTESGDPMQVSELVQEFLQTNPHFVQAGPKGSGTGNVTDTGGNTFDPTQLDMTKASDRAKFKEHQSKQGMM